MRIGINALYLLPGAVGGTETYLRNLLRILQEIDREDEFFLFCNQENAGTFELHEPNFHEVRGRVRAVRRAQRILWEQIALPVQVRSAKLDLLHSAGYTAPLWPGVPSVVTIFDLNYHFHPEDWSPAALWTMRQLIPRVAAHATRVITSSHSSERAIHEILGVDRSVIDVVHLGVDGNLSAPLAGEEETIRARYRLDGPFLLSVSASHPHKNLDGLLSAYEEACVSWPSPPPLVVVGIKGRQQQALEARLGARSRKGRVVLTGWIDAQTLGALYRAAHLFVFPSKYEGFGFPVLEAMQSGVPVVSSDAASLSEIVREAGVLVSPTDVAGMAAAMRSTWTNEELRRDLIARGREQAASFTWRRAAEQTLASYRRAFRDQRAEA